MFLDDKGLITQADGDGGDKLQREGFWYEGIGYNPDFPIPSGLAPYRTALTVLTDPITGNLMRDEIKYTEQLDPHDVSRDQLVSNVRACGHYGMSDITKRILVNVLKNFSRYPNNDIAFITDYARFIRSLRLWYLSPLCWLGDIQMIGSVILTILKAFDPIEVDDLNLIGDLTQAQHVYPTVFSFIARKMYKWLRPLGYKYALETYFSVKSGANQEFIGLWLPTVEKF